MSLAVVFLASAVLQFNDDSLDLAIWGSFYSTQGMLALGVVFNQCGYPASAFTMASLAMMLWSIIMLGLSIFKYAGASNAEEEFLAKEELAGAVLGFVSAGFHAAIFGGVISLPKPRGNYR